MRTAALALLLLPACAPGVDPQILPYFQSFERGIGKPTAGIGAKFGDVQANAAWTEIPDHGSRCVVISHAFWDAATEDQREEIVFHELGHAVLNRAHLDTIKADGCPTSIMAHWPFNPITCYSSNKPYYWDELAGR